METLIQVLKLLVGRSIEYKVSVTGDDEILIYRKQKDGTLVNLIIDEEGDLEMMYIPTDWAQSANKLWHSPLKDDIEMACDLFIAETKKI